MMPKIQPITAEETAAALSVIDDAAAAARDLSGRMFRVLGDDLGHIDQTLATVAGAVAALSELARLLAHLASNKADATRLEARLRAELAADREQSQ